MKLTLLLAALFSLAVTSTAVGETVRYQNRIDDAFSMRPKVFTTGTAQWHDPISLTLDYDIELDSEARTITYNAFDFSLSRPITLVETQREFIPGSFTPVDLTMTWTIDSLSLSYTSDGPMPLTDSQHVPYLYPDLTDVPSLRSNPEVMHISGKYEIAGPTEVVEGTYSGDLEVSPTSWIFSFLNDGVDTSPWPDSVNLVARIDPLQGPRERFSRVDFMFPFTEVDGIESRFDLGRVTIQANQESIPLFSKPGRFPPHHGKPNAIESIAVPEPSTWLLLGLGSLSLIVVARRRVTA